jgi:60s Acidic ribosomal protein
MFPAALEIASEYSLISNRPTSSRLSSRPPTSSMSSQYGQCSSQRYNCVVREREEHWANANAEQALEGKDVKDILLNVGSGGGAAAAPAGGAAAGGAAAAEEEAKEEEKEEGMFSPHTSQNPSTHLTQPAHREGRRVRRGYGIRPVRLSFCDSTFSATSSTSTFANSLRRQHDDEQNPFLLHLALARRWRLYFRRPSRGSCRATMGCSGISYGYWGCVCRDLRQMKMQKS